MNISKKSAARPEGSSRWKRRFVQAHIAVQVSMAIAPFWAVTVQAATRTDEDAPINSAAQQVSGLAQAHQSGNLSGYLGQQAVSAATGQAEAWLQQFGTARLELGVDQHFKPQTGALDLLLPLSQSEHRLLFTQNGIRNKEGQLTGNFGLGQRHFTDNWLFGYNAFYDQNFTRGHKRLGVGAEAWRDYLKLSGNGYYRLSNWRNSVDVEDYDARPANGFDVRAEAWLPAYPAIGGRLMYEKYYGNEVALFGKESRQSNPGAITAGVSYTPVPLVSFTADHKKGSNQKESLFGIQLNYQLGQSLSSQLDADAMRLNRTLAANRLALVERNNNIVLEYRKQEVIQLGLPAEITGRSGKTVALDYKVISKYGLDRIQWHDAELVAAGGRIIDAGNNQYQLVLPRYVVGAKNSYNLSGVALDKRKNRSKIATTQIIVGSPSISADYSSMQATPDVLIADGKATSQIRILLLDENNLPVTDMAAAIKLNLKQTSAASIKSKSRVAVQALQTPARQAMVSSISEKAPGEYIATLTAGTRAADAVLSAEIDALQLKPVTIKQISDAASAVVADGDLKLVVDNIVANGSTTAQAKARVTDASGNPVAGVEVIFTLSGSAQLAAGSTLKAISDKDGYVTVAFTDIVAEAVTVKAATANGGSASIRALFIGDAATATLDKNDLTVDRQMATADGSDKVVFRAVVRDAHSNLVNNVSVSWSSNGGALAAKSSKSGNDGAATVALSDTIAHKVQVQAQINSQAKVDAPEVTFSADTGSAGVSSGDFIVDKIEAIADGSDQATYTVTVKDKNGNLLAGQNVAWAANFGTLSAPSSVTGADGKAQVMLTSTQIGAAVVTAVVNNKPAVSARDVEFKADVSSASLANSDFTVDKTTIYANGTDAATFSAIVKDKNGNVVKNYQVSWNALFGNLSAAVSDTNEQGVATVRLTGTLVATVNATATVNGKTTSALSVNIEADQASATIANGDLTRDKSSALANGSDKITYKAVVKDANGNLVKNKSVSWTTNRGALSAASSTTDNNGEATITLTSTSAGSAQVRAAVNGNTPVNADLVAFSGNPASATIGNGDLTVDNQEIAAGTGKATFSALVKDANGNLVAGVDVSWTTSSGTLSGTTSKTNASGIATIELTDTRAGQTQVKASVNSGAQVNAPIVTVKADTASARIDSGAVTRDKATAIANSGEAITYSATVKDQYGNVLEGVQVAWSKDLGDLTKASSTSNASGIATTQLSATVLGAAIVNAQIASGTAVAAVSVDFTADAASASLKASDLTVDRQTAPADNTTVATYTALVKDQYGNPVKDISFGFYTDLGTISAIAVRTGIDGKATTTVRSNTPGTAHVHATLNSVDIDAPDVKFEADRSTAVVSKMTTSNGYAFGFGTINPTITVEVKNSQGQALANYKVSWSTAIGIIGSESFTDNSGTATIELNTLHFNQSISSGDVEATLENGNKKTVTQVIYPTYKKGNHLYFPEEHTNPTLVSWQGLCRDRGGRVASSADLANFASDGGDFVEARSLFPALDKYRNSNQWMRLSDSWDGVKGNFNSSLGTVGDTSTVASGTPTYAVCVL